MFQAIWVRSLELLKPLDSWFSAGYGSRDPASVLVKLFSALQNSQQMYRRS